MLRQRASFVNREGTFGNQEGMITDVFLDADLQSTPAFKLVPPLETDFEKVFQKRIASEYNLII